MRNYIVKDLLIWFSFLILLPVAVILIYYLAATDRTDMPNIVSHHVAFDQHELLMKKFLLSEALCNDGSQATYYIKQSSSKMWVILLEGGYFCFDRESCNARALNSANLTSSKTTKRFRRGRGIISSQPEENPFWHGANLVTIPYCSSDLWIGNKMHHQSKTKKQLKKVRLRSSSIETDATGFHFMGQRILDEVLDNLITIHGMSEANLIVLIGQSAGGIGLLMNANRIQVRLKVDAPQAQVKAVLDSSWLLDLPYSFLCSNSPTDDCFMNKILKSLNYWNAQLPSECSYDEEEKWDCFLPYKILPSIKIPVFVVQSLFDETLLIERFNSKFVSTESTRLLESMKFFSVLLDVHNRMLATLAASSHRSSNHAYFMPACIQHFILTRDDFSALASLASELNCWALALPNCTTTNSSRIQVEEECTWPNCRKTCPPLRHPDTNRAIDLIEYLSYFGVLNYRQVGDVLTMSETAVRSLDYDEIMRLVMDKINVSFAHS